MAIAMNRSTTCVNPGNHGASRRAIDPIWYRIAPRAALRSTARKSLLTIARRASAERAIQIIEMEESFGWAAWIRQATSIPVCVRLYGPWFLNGSVLGVPLDAEYRQRVRDEGKAIKLGQAVSAPSRNVLEQVRSFYGLDLPDAEVIPAPTLPVPVGERWRLEDCDSKQVVFVGRFDRHKGGDLIIEAFRKMIGVCLEKCNLLQQSVREGDVIRVHPRNILALCLVKHEIEPFLRARTGRYPYADPRITTSIALDD